MTTNEDLELQIRNLKDLVWTLQKRIDTMSESQKFIDQRHKFLEEAGAANFKLGHAAHHGNEILMKMYRDLTAHITKNANDIILLSNNTAEMAAANKKVMDAIQGKEELNFKIVK